MMNCDAGKASDDALGHDDATTSAIGYVTEGPLRVIEKSAFWRSFFACERMEIVDPEPIMCIINLHL